MGKIYIVIPVHNSISVTLKCLESLDKQTNKNYLIVVVDDGSTDGTSNAIAKSFPDIIVLRGNGHLWWTGATNLGVQYVLQKADESDYVLTLNNDLTVPQNYLQELLSSAVDYKNTLIGSVVLNDDDRNTIVDGGNRINWLTAKLTRVARGEQYDIWKSCHPTTINVDLLSGRGTLIPIHVFRKIGIFDCKRLPHYGADNEYACRARNKGFELIVNYNAIVYSTVRSTGYNNEYRRLSWNELLHSYFMRRSPNNLKYRIIFALRCCPKFLLPSFILCDILRVIIGPLRNQLVNNNKNKI